MSKAVWFVAGVVVGATGALLGPRIVREGRPMAKTAMKAIVQASAAARVRGAELVEATEDLIAEVRSELAPGPAPVPAKAGSNGAGQHD